MLGQNGEWANVARGQFPFDTEAANATKGRDMEVGFITNFIVNLLMVLVIVALLPKLSNLQILSYDSNLLLSFIDHIRTKECPLSGLGPI